VLAMEHFNPAASASLLVYATSTGGIHGWDLRAPSEAWSLQAPPNHGPPQSLCLGQNRLWMCAGSARGFFDCWDLRFQVLAHSWRHPSAMSITKLTNHPSPPQGQPWVVAATNYGAEVSTWDMESARCQEVYRAMPEIPSSSLWAPPESPTTDEYGLTDLSRPTTVQPAMQALHVPAGCDCLLTSGTDRRIRYWSTLNARESYTITGSYMQRGARTAYVESSVQSEGSSSMLEGARITQEVLADGSQNSRDGTLGSIDEIAPVHNGTKTTSPHHQDAVLDLVTADIPHQKVPTRVIISASRDGAVKVMK